MQSNLIPIFQLICALSMLHCGIARAEAENTDPLANLPERDLNAEFQIERIAESGLQVDLYAPDQDGQPKVRLLLHTSKPSITIDPPEALYPEFAEKVFLKPYEGRNSVEANTVTIKRRSRGWLIYIDETLSATLPADLYGKVQVSLKAKPASPDDSEAFLQRIAPFRFTDDFLVDEADDQGKELRQWETVSGKWQVYSVADAMRDQNAPMGRQRNIRRRQNSFPHAERSPNFYCLLGSGTNALFLTGHPFYDRYTLAAAVHAGEGENGLAFMATPGGGFHAFTAGLTDSGDSLRFTLWKSADGKPASAKTIAAWDTDLLPGQWHRISVTLHDSLIIPMVDNIELPAQKAQLPAGGRFGLYADGPEETRFDDVEAFSHENLTFQSVAEFNAALSHFSVKAGKAEGAIQIDERSDIGAAQPAEHIVLSAPEKGPALAVFGATTDAPHVLATAVHANGKPFRAGLLAGWTNDDKPYRFTLNQTETERVFKLEITAGGVESRELIGELALPAKASKTPVKLMLDATDPDGILRAYADGKLVLASKSPVPTGGAAGLYVAPGDSAGFALPWYRSARTVYRNKFEKTNAFVIDPFMKHWASPEGEWITTPDEETWLKGDRLGAQSIRLPWVTSSRLHLAVGEDQKNGPLQVVANGDKIELWLDEKGGTNVALVATAPVDKLDWQFTDEKGTQSNRWFSANLEGHSFWLRSGDRVLINHTITNAPGGRLTRVEGLKLDKLALTKVERTGVMDFLFTESLFDWTLNGGNWEVVNRFQCDPRWSHLNGESADTLAALWSHYEFEGDFCAEFYAGMRHGWYDRSGDLNLTVLGSVNSPASGYTFVCTGWDPDESQSLSRVFRDGKLIADTDRYLVPRIREGNVRKGYNPLIAGGRDVHGAWYYTQMRRSGENLHIAFDHEPVLTVRDPEPLARGGLGIWTYRNSMVVARVKMAAEKIRPKPFAIRPAPAKAEKETPWPASAMPVIEAVAKAAGVDPATLPASELNPGYPAWPESIKPLATTNGITLSGWTPDTWAARDPVSHAKLEWLPDKEAPDRFMMTAQLAGGTFLAAAELPPMPLRHLAGWRFEIAGTADSRVNFHYQVGRKPGEAFEPAQGFFHRISGSAETRGPYMQSGYTEIEPAAGASDLLEGPWTAVEVWLPAFPKEEDTLWVRVEGFGNLQPSDVQQGLAGNLPGAAYAVRNFAPILMGEPVTDPETASPTVHEIVKEAVKDNLQTEMRRLDIPPADYPLPLSIFWVVPPDNMNLAASWSEERHDAIEIKSEISWPIRYLKGLEAKVENKNAVVIPREGNRLQVLVPRDLAPPKSGIVQVNLMTSPRRPLSWGLPISARPKKAGPILLALKSGYFNIQNFERESAVGGEASNGAIRLTDPEQGSYLQTANRGRPLRLRTPLTGQVDLARNPVLRFRYRGEGYAKVSMRLLNLSEVNFTEKPPQWSAVDVRSTPAEVGAAWRSWSGYPVDAIAERAFNPPELLQVPSLSLRSTHRIDQTGRYATLAVDDIVAGPAVGAVTNFTVTPVIFDLDGDGFAEWCLLPHPDIAAEEPDITADTVKWTRGESGGEINIPVAELPDGLYQLCARAASPRAAGPALRIPILKDTKPIQVTHQIVATPKVDNETMLQINLNLLEGSPPQMQKLGLFCGEEKITLSRFATRVSFARNLARLRLNWPLILRKQIQAAKDGDTLAMRIEGVEDGAGNIAEQYKFEIPIDFSADKTSPTVRNVTTTTNIFWSAGWFKRNYATAFQKVQHCSKSITDLEDRSSVSTLRVNGPNAFATQEFENTPWDPRAYPWLALRVGFHKLPPKLNPDSLQLVLLYKEGKNKPQEITRNLAVPQNDLPTGISGKVDWTENGVSELFIDVPKILSRDLKGKTPSGHIIGLRLAFQKAQQAQIYIHQAFIGSGWAEQDRLDVRAYDASGLAGLVWQGDNKTDTLFVMPAALKLPENDASWMRLQVLDRPGNLSPVIHFPVFPKPPAPPPEPKQAEKPEAEKPAAEKAEPKPAAKEEPKQAEKPVVEKEEPKE